jgi:probable HAF family extracellular repeat protein
MRNITRTIGLATLGLAFATGAAWAGGITYTTLDFPGATSTYPQSINNHGQVVGFYTDSSGSPHGFIEAGGTYTTLDIPGALATDLTGINNSGQILAVYVDAGGQGHDAIDTGGTLSQIQVAGASSTVAYGLNDHGDVVGYYIDGAGANHGFLFKGGSYQTFDYPGATLTWGVGINNAGQIVGVYEIERVRDFAYRLDGTTFTTLVVNYDSDANGINNLGQIVGTYNDGTYRQDNPYVQDVGGATITLDVPGMAFGGATGINDLGQVVGWYEDASGSLHGYLADTASVPEPSTLILAGLSVIGLIVHLCLRRTWAHATRRLAKAALRN